MGTSSWRAISAAVIAAVAGVASASSVSAAATPSGSAGAAAVEITVNPAALLSIPAALCGPALIDCSTLRAATSPVQIQLGDAHASGTLVAGKKDLALAHADVTLLKADNAALSLLLNNLKTALDGALGTADFTSLPLSGDSHVDALTTMLSSATAPLATEAQQALNQLVQGLQADLPAGSQQNGTAVTLLGVTTPVSAQATAVNATEAEAKGLSGARAEARQTINALTDAQNLGLQSLDSTILGAAAADLTTIKGDVLTTVALLTPLAGVNDTTTAAALVTALAGTVPALAPTLNTLASELSSSGITVSAAITQLNGYISQLDAALGQLTVLGGLADQLPNLILGDLFSGTDLNSSALTEPSAVGVVHSRSTTRLQDLTVGTQLLEITGISSTADTTVDGVSTTLPTGNADLTAVKVLGTPITGIDALFPGQVFTKAITVGEGTLTLVVTKGKANPTSTTATHKSEDVTALDIQLWNGDPSGVAPPVTGLGGKGLITEVTVAAVTVDDVAALVSTPNTGTGGEGSLLAGGALLGAGVVLLALGRPPRRRGCG